jgi:hypothetical protein
LNYKQSFKRNLSNIPGKRIYRKIIVFESDDWGSIRMPSRVIFEDARKSGLDLEAGDNRRFNRFDNLASSADLELLFELLSSVKDVTGRSVVFTPVSLVANPDFDKIKDSGFSVYFFEPFTETLKRFKGCEDSFMLWKEGIRNRLFVPQFHGREHLNVLVWLKALQEKDPDASKAFDFGLWGFYNKHPRNVSFQAAFDLDDPQELEYHKSVILSGLELFEKLHGYSAKYFVPPNGPVNNMLLGTAAEKGIRFVSAAKIQSEALGNGRTRKVFHWQGQLNRYKQRNITRNCFFEPSFVGIDWVDSCMNDIRIAFKWRKPAIISTHRINYIGSLYPENRDNGLRELRKLLQAITKNWPEAEFMTTEELGNLISGDS